MWIGITMSIRSSANQVLKSNPKAKEYSGPLIPRAAISMGRPRRRPSSSVIWRKLRIMSLSRSTSWGSAGRGEPTNSFSSCSITFTSSPAVVFTSEERKSRRERKKSSSIPSMS